MTAASRLADGYQPDFDLDLEYGRQGELFASRAIDAINSGQSVEIKTDDETARTGNVYIELECFVSGQWVGSGVNTKAFLWAHVIVGGVVVFALKEHVRTVAMTYGKPGECKRGSHPTRGRLIPVPQFVAALTGVAKRSGVAWILPAEVTA
jgi:hypothetical protein